MVERVHRMFDLDSDPRVINEVLRHDPLLAPLVRARPGARVPGAWDGFELAVRALLGQQVTVAGATTLAGRLCDAFGEPGPFSGTGLSRLFPTPAALADGDVARIGMPRRRAEAIRTLAREVRDGRIVLEPSADPGETATRLEMAARLGRIAGIGDWTVQYVAMRALRDPDGFPAGDLGLLRAVARSLPEGERRTLNASALARRAEAWRPWRAYAAIQLWLSGSAEGQARRQAPPK